MDVQYIKKRYKSFKSIEFEEYFSEIGQSIEDGCYFGDGWKVCIGKDEISSKSPFFFNEVDIELWLREDIKEEFLKTLMMRFLRGGG
jgi:hypothetical protein